MSPPAPDPSPTFRRRAARVTLVGVPLYALLGWGFDLTDAAGPAVFAVFTLGAFADFTGRPARRARRYLCAGVVAMLMFPLATVVEPWPAATVAVTGAVTFAAFFASALGGPWFPARFPVVIAWLYAATIDSTWALLGERVLGWALGTVCITIGALVLWPVRRPLTVRTATAHACTAAGDVVADRWLAGRSGRAGLVTGRVRDADERLERSTELMRTTALDAHLHPGAVAADERVLAVLVHEVQRLAAHLVAIRPPGGRGADGRPAGPDDDVEVDLAAATRTALRDTAALLLPAPSTNDTGSGAGATGSVSAALAEAVRLDVAAARTRLTEAAHRLEPDRGAAAGDPTDLDRAGAVVDVEIERVAPRIAATRTVIVVRLAEAFVAARHGASSTTPTRLRADGPLTVLRAHLDVRSPWFRNAVRAAVALMVAVSIVLAGAGRGHGFWLALGSFSVLRADLVTMGRSAWSAVIGTVVGFLLSSLLVVTVGDVTWVLWVLLPITMYLASENGRYRQEVGAAAFTVFLVVLYTLLAPSGLAVGEARLLDVTIGAAITLAIGAVLWPRIGAVPGELLADVVERCRATLRAATAAIEPPDGGAPDEPAASPLPVLTELDRVLDTLATSAPDALAATDREFLIATVDATVTGAAVLVGRASDVGAAPQEIDPFRDELVRFREHDDRPAELDEEARRSLRADIGVLDGHLGALAARLDGRTAEVPAPPSALRDLAALRLSQGAAEEAAALVRAATILGHVSSCADRTRLRAPASAP